MRTQLLIAGLTCLMSTTTFASPLLVKRPSAARPGRKAVSTTIFGAGHDYRPSYTYYPGGGRPGYQVWTDGSAHSFGGARWASAKPPAPSKPSVTVSRPADAKSGKKSISMGSGMSGMIGPAYYTNRNGYRVDIGTHRAFQNQGLGERMGLYGPHGQYPNQSPSSSSASSSAPAPAGPNGAKTPTP